MKRILITAIILLAWAPAWAGSTTVVVGQGSAAPAGDTCDTTCDAGTQDFSGGDNESFESGTDGTFCTADWSVNDADSMINTSDTAQAHCGTHALSVVVDSDNTGTNNVQVDLGAEDSDIYLRYYFRCPNVANYKVLRHLLFYNTNADSVVGGVRVRDWSTGEQLYLEVSGTLDDEYFPLTAGNWYRIDLHVVGSAGNMTMQVHDSDGNAIQTSTGGGDVESSLASANYNTRIIRFWDYYDNAAAISYYIDDIMVDLDGTGYIGGCTCP